MKYFFALISIVAAFNVCVEAGKYTAIIKSMAGGCKAQENASDQDVDQLANGIAPETREGKCLAACMGKQFGLIADNKLSKEGFMNKMNFILTDEGDKKKAEKIADDCKDVTNADRCEAAHDIWDCVEKGCKANSVSCI